MEDRGWTVYLYPCAGLLVACWVLYRGTVRRRFATVEEIGLTLTPPVIPQKGKRHV